MHHSLLRKICSDMTVRWVLPPPICETWRCVIKFSNAKHFIVRVPPLVDENTSLFAIFN